MARAVRLHCAILLLVVKEEGAVCKAADQVIASVLRYKPGFPHAGNIPKSACYPAPSISSDPSYLVSSIEALYYMNTPGMLPQREQHRFSANIRTSFFRSFLLLVEYCHRYHNFHTKIRIGTILLVRIFVYRKYCVRVLLKKFIHFTGDIYLQLQLFVERHIFGHTVFAINLLATTSTSSTPCP